MPFGPGSHEPGGCPNNLTDFGIGNIAASRFFFLDRLGAMNLNREWLDTCKKAAGYARLAYARNYQSAAVPFTNANAAGVINVDHEETWIGIRGSDDIYDWAYNRNTKRVLVAGSLVHEGFYDYTKLVIDAIERLAKNAKIPNGWNLRTVYLCGHSLGGAAARLIPTVCKGFRVNQIVTFGAPPTHVDSAAAIYNFPLTEFRLPWDPFPHLPLGKDWGECGKIVRINGKLDTGNESVWQKWMRRLWLAYCLRRGPGYLKRQVSKHHSMDLYSRAIHSMEAAA